MGFSTKSGAPLAKASEAGAAEEADVKAAPADGKAPAPAPTEPKLAPGYVEMPKPAEAPADSGTPDDVLGDSKPEFDQANTDISL